MNNTNRLIAAALVVAFGLAVFATTVDAATVAYGSQVKLGDNDFLPTSSAAGIAASATPLAGPGPVAGDTIKEVNFGTGGIADSCFYWSLGAVLAVAKFDVRLTPCQGKAAGTQVTDADVAEKAAAVIPATVVAAPGVSIKYADLNSNGRYDKDDAVYLASNAVATAGFPGSTSTTIWTIRLTGSGSFGAGTIVKPGDSDQVAYGGTALGIAAAVTMVFDADLSGAVLNGGDALYLSPVAIGAAGVAVPVYSVRLANGPLAFGTQVKLGDSDFKPTALVGPVVALAAGAAVGAGDTIKETNFGTGGIADSCFYYQPVPTLLIAKGDVRLVPCQGKAAGTQVTDADVAEKAATTIIARVSALAVVFADVNSNGRYDMADQVYLTNAAAGFGGSTGTTAWTIRLTPAGSFAAGTLVKPGDSDQIAYGATAGAIAVSGVSVFDVDLSATANLGDAFYLAVAATATGARFPVYSLRLANGPLAFGTQLKFGDADFLPTMLTAGVPMAAATVKQVNFGTGAIADSCFYSGPAGAPSILKFDIRLTPCQGKAAGTQVTDADVAEKAATVVAVSFGTVTYADINADGRYNNNDCAFATTGAAPGFRASTGIAAWAIRLTPCMSFGSGTLVKPGDSDQVAYGATALVFPGTFQVSFFDTDLSGGTTPNAGDVAYLNGAAGAAGAGFPVYSVRLAGIDVVNAAPNPSNSNSASNSVSGSVSGSVSSSVSGSVSTSHSSTTGAATTTAATSSTSGKAKTPGFELVALVAALGAALVMVRRKL